jgi:hypothetical protein
MKDRIQEILERELNKLNQRSIESTDPLGVHDVRSLDTLIKAYNSFVLPTQPPAAPTQPANTSTQDLLNGLVESDSAETKA